MASPLHAQAFLASLLEAKAHHEHGWQLHTPSLVDLEKCRLWLTPDSMGGAAVTPDGDLVSVFRHPKGSSISSILREAAEEAVTLDCFDVGYFLPRLYEGLGFVSINAVRFDPELAPWGWDETKHGRPNVVLMAKRAALRSDWYDGLSYSHGDPTDAFTVFNFNTWENAAADRRYWMGQAS